MSNEPRVHHWLGIEIGYVTAADQQAKSAPARQQSLGRLLECLADLPDQLRTWFPAATRLRWIQGGSTSLGCAATRTASNSECWAGEVLQAELRTATKDQGADPALFAIDESDLVCLGPHATSRGARKLSGDHGTDCKLVGDRWVNGRRYALSAFAEHLGLPASVLLFACLTWDCPGAVADVRRLLHDKHLLPATEAAAGAARPRPAKPSRRRRK